MASTEAQDTDDVSNDIEQTETAADAEPETVIGYRILRRDRVVEVETDDDAEEEVRPAPYQGIIGSHYLYRKNAAKRMAELRAERGETKEYKLVEVRESLGGDRREVDVGAIEADDDE